MTGQLVSDSFEIERFYPQSVSEFDDLLSTIMLALPADESLKHEDCISQLRKGADGSFIQLFGGLNRIKTKLDDETFQSLSRGISAAFYQLKWGQDQEFHLAIRQLKENLESGLQLKKSANDA